MSSKFEKFQERSIKRTEEIEAEDEFLERFDSGKDRVKLSIEVFKMFNRMALENIDPAINDSCWYTWLGERGTGKSTMSIVQAFALDKDFSTDLLVFEVKDMIGIIKENNRVPVVWEEAGVGMYSRDFMTKTNKQINKVMQMFRYKNIVLISNFQHLGLLDNHARMQINKIFWCKSKSSRNEDGSLFARKMFSPHVVLSTPFTDPFIRPYKMMFKDKSKREPVGWMPLPTEEQLFREFGVKQSFISDYKSAKNEFFEKLGEEEEDEDSENGSKNEYGMTVRQAEMYRCMSQEYAALVEDLTSNGIYTKVDISKKVNANYKTFTQRIKAVKNQVSEI